MKIFFDVDYTILGLDDTLRPGTVDTFQKLLDDGHEIYIWSGMGERWEVIEKHELGRFVSGVYEKPTHHYHERLAELKVPVEPEFVIDDYPEIVAAFGGVWVPPYFFSRSVDTKWSGSTASSATSWPRAPRTTDSTAPKAPKSPCSSRLDSPASKW